ncbi:MAG: hypothetical protein OK452_09230 [Thaumarchaeota archaeon]|nr:hypothetical protein [Nitrososphaerota archaeon]
MPLLSFKALPDRWGTIEISTLSMPVVGEVMYSTLTMNGRFAVAITIATVLAWLGEVIHNVLELPGLTVLSPEASIPGVIAALLLAAYLFAPYPRVALWLLLSWGLLGLIGGGILSVLPIGIFPFTAAQNLQHYLTHIFYGAAELPLVLTTIIQLRRRRVSEPSGGGP